MASCTFFGHRDCPELVKPALQAAIEHLICCCAVDRFYVGNHGKFDRMVLATLRMLAEDYPWIRYEVVLAYIPQRNQLLDGTYTVLPEGIEQVPKRFAIDFRNRWMLERADYVIAAIDHPWGGAAKYVQRAERIGKEVIHLLRPEQ